MDTAISNGDFKVDSRGIPVIVSDFEEILQRVLIRVGTKSGSFIYDAELGSDIHSLKCETENLNDKALAIVRRAIVGMCGVSADEAVVTKNDDNMNIKVSVRSGEEQGEVELII